MPAATNYVYGHRPVSSRPRCQQPQALPMGRFQRKLWPGQNGQMHANSRTSHEILHGDARVLLPELAFSGLASAARLVYADPPYNTRRSERGPFRDHRTDEDWSELIRAVAEGSRTLLRADGSFWLQVNDQQLGLARQTCDAVFGSANYVGTVVWERTRRPSYLHGQLAGTLDFLLVYARDRSQLPPFVSGTTEPGKRVPLAHRGNPVVTLIFPAGCVRFTCADGPYRSGDHSSPGIAAELLDDVFIAAGRNVGGFRLRLPSRYSPARLTQMLGEGAEILIPKVPFRPSYLSPGGKPKLAGNLWSWQLDADMPSNEDAYREQKVFADDPFAYAKPVALLRRILELATEPGDLVVDPFGGSGTTAQAARETGRSSILIEEQLSLIEQYQMPRASAVIAGAL